MEERNDGADAVGAAEADRVGQAGELGVEDVGSVAIKHALQRRTQARPP